MENACTFFWHSNTPGEVEKFLEQKLQYLIENEDVNCFYIGTHGEFDRMAYVVLKRMKIRYPQIQYYRVLSCIPIERNTYLETDTLIPEGIETVHGRYSIIYRNKWMLSKSQYVVVYVKHSYGGATQFADIAKRQGKRLINLAQYMK